MNKADKELSRRLKSRLRALGKLAPKEKKVTPASKMLKPINPEAVLRSTAVGKVARRNGLTKSQCGSAIHYDHAIRTEFEEVLIELKGVDIWPSMPQ